jgi:hypothetical protein
VHFNSPFLFFAKTACGILSFYIIFFHHARVMTEEEGAYIGTHKNPTQQCALGDAR